MPRSMALVQTIIVGGVNVLATFVSIATVDRVGRRPLLVQGGLQMMLALVRWRGTGRENFYYLHHCEGVAMVRGGLQKMLALVRVAATLNSASSCRHWYVKIGASCAEAGGG